MYLHILMKKRKKNLHDICLKMSRILKYQFQEFAHQKRGEQIVSSQIISLPFILSLSIEHSKSLPQEGPYCITISFHVIKNHFTLFFPPKYFFQIDTNLYKFSHALLQNLSIHVKYNVAELQFVT